MKIFNTVFFTDPPGENYKKQFGDVPLNGNGFEIHLLELSLNRMWGKNISIITKERKTAVRVVELISACYFLTIAEPLEILIVMNYFMFQKKNQDSGQSTFLL